MEILIKVKERKAGFLTAALETTKQDYIRISRMVIWQKNVPGLSDAGFRGFLMKARKAVKLQGDVQVLITSNSQMRALNRQFRGKDKATDVLSFPAAEPAGTKSKLKNAGDIAISFEIAARNARQLGHSTAFEIKILALHGILHLAGYDHESDNGKMARKEAQLRRELRLPDGLIERGQAETSPERSAETSAATSKGRRRRLPASVDKRRRSA